MIDQRQAETFHEARSAFQSRLQLFPDTGNQERRGEIDRIDLRYHLKPREPFHFGAGDLIRLEINHRAIGIGDLERHPAAAGKDRKAALPERMDHGRMLETCLDGSAVKEGDGQVLECECCDIDSGFHAVDLRGNPAASDPVSRIIRPKTRR